MNKCTPFRFISLSCLLLNRLTLYILVCVLYVQGKEIKGTLPFLFSPCLSLSFIAFYKNCFQIALIRCSEQNCFFTSYYVAQVHTQYGNLRFILIKIDHTGNVTGKVNTSSQRCTHRTHTHAASHCNIQT